MPDSRLSRHPYPRTETDPTKQRGQESRKAENKVATFFVCYHHSTSYLFHQPKVAAMIKSCMLQLITSPCYDAEMMVACLSANSVRRSSRSKKLHTFPGLSDNNADGGLNVVAYLKVSTQ